MKILSCLIFFLYSLVSTGQNFQYSFDHLTTKDDLAQNSVLSIVQDHKGFMWFGTQSGVDRYDGVSFMHFSYDPSDSNSMQQGFVNTIYQGRTDKTLYIGTTYGLCQLNPESLVFKTIDLNKSALNNIIAIKNGGSNNIIIASERAVYFYSGGKIYPVKSNVPGIDNTIQIYDVVTDTSEGYGILATNSGLYLLDLKAREISGKIILSGLHQSIVIRRLIFRKNELIIATESQGLYSFKPNWNPSLKTMQLSLLTKLEYDEQNGFDRCTTLYYDSAGTLWAGTERNGVIFFSTNSKKGIRLARNNNLGEAGLSSNYIRSIYQSRDGVIWIGTNENGVNKLSSNKPNIQKYFISGYSNYTGLKPNNDVWAILPYDSTSVLLGTDGNGIVQLQINDNTRFKQFASITDEESNVVRSITPFNNTLLIGTNSGLFSINKDNLSSFGKKPRLLKGNILSVFVSDSNIYVGTSKEGMIILDFRLNLVHKLFNEEKDARTVNCFTADRYSKVIYAGTSRGVVVVKKQDGENLVTQSWLKKYNITSIVQRHDSLWVGTSGNGLFCIDRRDGKGLDTITRRKGLLDNTIYGLLPDEQGRLWISTNKGISVYDISNQTFNSYTTQNGLQHEEYNLGAYYKSYSGKSETLYFGGVNGFNIIIPRSTDTKVSKEYEANSYYYKGKDYEFNPNVYSFGDKIMLDRSYNYAILGIRLFNYEDPYNNKYKYRLNSGDWSEEQKLTENIRLTQSRFRTGNNILEVQVRSTTGDWQLLPALNLYKKGNFNSWFNKYWKWLVTGLAFAGMFIWLFFSKKRSAKKRVKEYEIIKGLINEISRAGDVDAIIKESISHISSSPVFNFDYVVFSLVNYQMGEIVVQQSVNKSSSIIEPTAWRKVRPSFSLSSKDVMAVSVSRNKVFEVVGNKIYDRSVGKMLVSDDGMLDKEVYETFDHKDLVRMFVPVQSGSDPVGAESVSGKVIGLIEAGFHRSSKNNISDDLAAKLGLYANHLALAIHSALFDKAEKQSAAILKEAQKESGDNHLHFLELILQKTCKSLSISRGGIALITLNNPDITVDDISFSFPQGNRKLDFNGLEPLLAFKAEKIIIRSKEGFLGNEKCVYSALSAPIRYEGITLGTVEMFGKGHEFFDEFSVTVINKLTESLGEEYISKKFHAAVAKLSAPETLLDNPKANISNSIETIKEYFSCDFISFWERDFDEEKEVLFFQSEASSEIKSQCNNYGNKKISLSDDIAQFEPIDVSEQPGKQSEPFRRFAQEHKILSFIHVPLSVGKAKYGFLNIYSRLKLDKKLFEEDKQFLELLSNKAAASHLSAKMVSSFSEISKKMAKKELGDILNSIADAARRVLNSDPVILFQYDEQFGGIQYDKTVISGDLISRDKVLEGQKADFIEIILAQGEGDFYENKDKLPKRYRSNLEKLKTDDDSFWTRENISSVAVAVLKYETKPVGIMCFNYHQPQVFSQQIQRLINTFSGLAAAAIVSIADVDTIKKQAQKLQRQAQELKAHNDQVRTEKDTMAEEIKELLPNASAASLAEIIRAVNHDIRNHLIRIEQNMLSIKKDSFTTIRSSSDRSKLEDNIKVINKNIDNTTNLITLFEPESFDITVEELEDIVNSVKKLFIEQFGQVNIKVHCSILSDKIPSIRCSKAEMSMIVYNLISNARNAINEKWAKKGKSKEGPEGLIEVKIDYDNSEKQYIITVEDDGTGIDNSIKDRIFDIKFTTRTDETNKGLGIGLYFVKGTLERLYDGEINVTTAVGTGTKFTLKFKQHIK